jgi:hypothetical protein
MAIERLPFDVGTSPEIAALAEEVRRTRTPRVLQRNGEALAYLEPVSPEREPQRVSRKRADKSTLLGLLAISETLPPRPDGPTDVARNKHRYIAEALAAEKGQQEGR